MNRGRRSMGVMVAATLLWIGGSITEQPCATAEEAAVSLARPEGEAESRVPRWWDLAGVGGHARFDYYSASKQLNNVHSLPGLTIQPRALPRFGTWGDAKIEGRLQEQDLRGPSHPQGRLLEAYANLYFGSVDLRVGKQIIPWGRADVLNPTDYLTPKDFTLLSALDEEERRTGSGGIRANYYRGTYTLSLVWLPLFNPNTIPLAAPPGISIIHEKRSAGDWTDQGFAIKLDQTGGGLDWSLSYYYGLDINPIVRPIGPMTSALVHTRIRAIGADFARVVGRYNLRGEGAYVQTQNPSGADPFILKPYVYYVLGVDRDVMEDLNVNVQGYQRIIINYRDPFQIQDPTTQTLSVLNGTFNYQLDRVAVGMTGRIKATWLNKTLEGEVVGQWNATRGDFFLRPSLAYAFTDTWKGFVGYDIFNGQTHSFFGRLQPMTAAFVELRATF